MSAEIKMNFALRAFWVISPNEELPVFQRLFSTVEMRAKKLEKYQSLPEQHDFVEAVLVEIGIKHPESFIMSRDRCDKKCLAPAFQINVAGLVLEPIVILQHRGLLLCALPLVDDTESSVLEVAQTLDCLNVIADRLSGDLSQRNDLKNQLTKLMVVNFPFGSPQTENINLSEKIVEATLKEPLQDKVKVPVWNPSPTPKSKNVFAFLVSEQIHSTEDGTAYATGTISVAASETCEIQPEVNLTLTHPNPLQNMSLAPRAHIESTTENSTTIKFNPTVGIKLDLMHYSLICQNPLDCITLEGANSYKLTIRPTKAVFQRLEVKFPTKGKLQFSVGTAFEVDDNTKWDIPTSKIKSKPAEIQIIHTTGGKKKIIPEASFKLASDSCWSGLKLVTNSLAVNGRTAKVKCSAVSESVSGNFQINMSV